MKTHFYKSIIDLLVDNAVRHSHLKPNLQMLVEEVGELAAALGERHEHEPSHELIQIGGITLNWLMRLELQDRRDER